MGAGLTCGDHRETSPALVVAGFFCTFTHHNNCFVKQAHGQRALPFTCAWLSWGIICPSYSAMVRPTSNCAFTVLLGFFFFSAIVYEIRVWERTASSHLQRVTRLTPADKQRHLITTHTLCRSLKLSVCFIHINPPSPPVPFHRLSPPHPCFPMRA